MHILIGATIPAAETASRVGIAKPLLDLDGRMVFEYTLAPLKARARFP